MTESTENTIKSITGIEITGNRVQVTVDLADNHTKPNLVMVLSDGLGHEISRSIIMGVIDTHVEFTLHIRVPNPEPPISLTGTTYIEEEQPVDSKSIDIARLV